MSKFNVFQNSRLTRIIGPAVVLAIFSLGVTGCSESTGTQTLTIPADNPYQQTPEEIAKYNADGAEKSEALRAEAGE